MMRFFVFAAVAALIFFTGTTSAQRIHAGVLAFPSRPFTDTSGSVSMQRVQLGVSYPLYTSVRFVEGRLLPSIRSLQVSVNTTYSHLRTSLLPDHLHSISLSAGLSYFSYSGGKGSWLAHASPLVSAPADDLGSSPIGLFGFGMYQRRVNTEWSYRAGLLWIEYNRSLVLPLLGFDYRFSRKEWLQVNLPLNVVYHNRPKPGTEWRAGLGFNGFFSQVSTTPAPYYLRLQQLLLTGSYSKRIHQHWNLTAGAGIAGARQLHLLHTRDDRQTEKVKGGLFAQLSVQYRFANSRKKEKRTLAAEPTDVFNLDEFSPEDPDKLEEELELDDQ